MPNGLISNLYGKGPGTVFKVELMRHPRIKQLNAKFNFDEVKGENRQEDNLRWPQIPEHP